MRAFLLLALALIGVTDVQPSIRGADDSEKKALKAIEGTYSLQSIESEGKAITPPQKETFVIRGDKFIAVRDGGKEDPIQIKIDSSKAPGRIDMIEELSGKKTRTTYGIFKLEKEILTLCVSDTEDPKDRPTEFKTEKPKRFIMILKRVEVPKKP